VHDLVRFEHPGAVEPHRAIDGVAAFDAWLEGEAAGW
jgi:hypothetical protein